MGIEKDIQQTNFRNEFQKMSINIIYTANWLNEKMGQILLDLILLIVKIME